MNNRFETFLLCVGIFIVFTIVVGGLVFVLYVVGFTINSDAPWGFVVAYVLSAIAVGIIGAFYEDFHDD